MKLYKIKTTKYGKNRHLITNRNNIMKRSNNNLENNYLSPRLWHFVRTHAPGAV